MILPLSNMLQLLVTAIFLCATLMDVVTCTGCGLFGCLSGKSSKDKIGTMGDPEEVVRVRVENNGVFVRYCTGAVLKLDVLLIGIIAGCAHIEDTINYAATVEFGSGTYQITSTEKIGNNSLACKLASPIAGLSSTFQIGSEDAPHEGHVAGYSHYTGACKVLPVELLTIAGNGDLVFPDNRQHYGSVFYTYDQRRGVPILHAIGTLVPPEELVRVRVENNGAFAQYRTGAMLKKDIVLIGDREHFSVLIEDAVDHQAFVEFGSDRYQIMITERVGNKSLVCKLESAIDGLSTTFEIGTRPAPEEGLIGGYSWLTETFKLLPAKVSTRRSNGDLVFKDIYPNWGSVYYTYDQRSGVPNLHAVCTGVSDGLQFCTDMHVYHEQITDVVSRLSAATNVG